MDKQLTDDEKSVWLLLFTASLIGSSSRQDLDSLQRTQLSAVTADHAMTELTKRGITSIP